MGEEKGGSLSVSHDNKFFVTQFICSLMRACSTSLVSFRAELTQLQIVIARRWRLRCYARLRRRVMARWAVGRRKIFYKMWGEWRHSIRTIQEHRRCAKEIALEVRAAQYFSHSYYAWAFDTWTAWLASWLEYQRKLRQAYALWRKIEVNILVCGRVLCASSFNFVVCNSRRLLRLPSLPSHTHTSTA